PPGAARAVRGHVPAGIALEEARLDITADHRTNAARAGQVGADHQHAAAVSARRQGCSHALLFTCRMTSGALPAWLRTRRSVVWIRRLMDGGSFRRACSSS